MDNVTCYCTTGRAYQEDSQRCEPFALEEPHDKQADEGPPFCCSDHVGEPINPATGNMWHTEIDYASSSPGGLAVTRTYNSSPHDWDAGNSQGFGARWSQPYGATLKPELASANGSGQCMKRVSTGYVWCTSPPAPPVKPIPDAISIRRGDGKKYVFQRNGAVWTSDANVNDRVSATLDSGGTTVVGWTYVSAQDDRTERFDANGALISITARDGTMRRFTYSNGATNDSNVGRVPAGAPPCSNVQSGATLPAGRLLCVTDNWGHTLQYEYNALGGIAKIIDPAGQAILYEYDGPSGGCVSGTPACAANKLTKVTYPDEKSRVYYYNESAQINHGGGCLGNFSNLLTGLVDENGERHISWTYNCQGLATSSELGHGVEKVELTYTDFHGEIGLEGAIGVNVTHYTGPAENPVATTSARRYEYLHGSPKLAFIETNCRECGPLSSITYDANGNKKTSIDWNNSNTTYVYDLTRNLETSRTEASGTPLARTITTKWHPSYRLPAQIAEPLRMSTLAYDTSGNLFKRTEQATLDANGSQGLAAPVVGAARIVTYTYNTAGQVSTVTGPRTDVLDMTKYDYDLANGNLHTITNALKQVTTLTNYDANGRVGHIVAPNGATTDLTYWPRGWLKQRTVSAGGINETTDYSYDGVGQLKLVTLPDHSTMSFVYDDAHRLSSVSDSLGNKVSYTPDVEKNHLLDSVTDPVGTLTRQITRVYDALNLLKQQTGGAQ
ncbi:YD repeat-containing protein [Oxalobacteraceae bacterium GrIS 1.11]